MTIKGLGDQSRAVARLRPGTWVAIEGPYGAFTRHAMAGAAVALVGAGVGVTPLRALLEDLPAGTDVAVVVRASDSRCGGTYANSRRVLQAQSGSIRGVSGAIYTSAGFVQSLQAALHDLGFW